MTKDDGPSLDQMTCAVIFEGLELVQLLQHFTGFHELWAISVPTSVYDPREACLWHHRTEAQ